MKRSIPVYVCINKIFYGYSVRLQQRKNTQERKLPEKSDEQNGASPAICGSIRRLINRLVIKLCLNIVMAMAKRANPEQN